MDPQTKRTIIAVAVSLVVLLGWLKGMEYFYPAPPPSAQPAASGPIEQPSGVGGGEPTAAITAPSSTSSNSTPPLAAKSNPPPATEAFHVVNAEHPETVTLGDDYFNAKGLPTNPYDMKLTITPVGAGIESLNLSGYRNELPKDKKHPTHDPYHLLSTVEDTRTGAKYCSFVTENVLLVEDKQTVDLSAAAWATSKNVDSLGETATLTTTIARGSSDLIRLTKKYRLEKNSRQLQIELEAENLSNTPRRVIITQRGPIGLKNEDPKTETRRVIVAVRDATGKAINGETATRGEILKTEDRTKELRPGEDRHTIWSAIGNKYFTCLVTPVPIVGQNAQWPEYLGKLTARSYFADPLANEDITFEEVFTPSSTLMPGQKTKFQLDVYCGPKSDSVFSKIPDAIARHYELVSSPDRGGCTFQPLPSIMLWLLTHLYGVVHNYGVAIICLVIIVRLILHPISKRGQVNMMKMQKGMARLKPKIDAIQAQYKNDKQKLNEETMKLYREEGINPASQAMGCLPMFLQMPIWVALWTTLNTNVDLRHMPFFGWIKDLSAPDALISISPQYQFTIPILGAMMGGPVRAFNLLPILMVITMYMQQKLTQKLTQPSTPLPPKLDDQGNPIPDPMAQQQKMMGYMMFFFGFLFYNFPSGLNLYILSSNLLGMAEQYQIKKHIRTQEARGEFDIKKKDSVTLGRPEPSRLGFLERLAKKAEQAKMYQSGRGKPPRKKKAPRF